jgi:hypothetical protein
VYHRAKFFQIEFPLKIDEIKEKLKKLKDHKRKVVNKNNLIKKIELVCTFENKTEKSGNYFLGLDLEYQISPRKGVRYQTTRDLFAIIFFPKKNILTILGRDDAITEIIPIISEILYKDADKLNVFKHVKFDIDSVIDIIKLLRKDDDDSWCNEYRGNHDVVKYEGKKTKSNFSLGEGNCVLDDSEAIQAINQSSSISPTFKFYRCPKLNSEAYDTPKTITFNTKKGTIGISMSQEFENWYNFISNFILKNLRW